MGCKQVDAASSSSRGSSRGEEMASLGSFVCELVRIRSLQSCCCRSVKAFSEFQIFWARHFSIFFYFFSVLVLVLCAAGIGSFFVQAFSWWSRRCISLLPSLSPPLPLGPFQSSTLCPFRLSLSWFYWNSDFLWRFHHVTFEGLLSSCLFVWFFPPEKIETQNAHPGTFRIYDLRFLLAVMDIQCPVHYQRMWNWRSLRSVFTWSL